VGLGGAATLEQLSLDQMAKQSTEIVRGRVLSSTVDQRGGVLYTRSRLQVAERWKGNSSSVVEVSVPGGKLGNLNQTFSGAPKLEIGTEYVLFLWTGKSGVTQVIGLSQGLFSLTLDTKGQARVERAAAAAEMLDGSGRPVQDAPVAMTLAALDRSIRQSLGAAK
jgi:hypothetical protein